MHIYIQSGHRIRFRARPYAKYKQALQVTTWLIDEFMFQKSRLGVMTFPLLPICDNEIRLKKMHVPLIFLNY